MKRKTIIPNDFGDFLRILSIIGFMGIFLKFALSQDWLSNHMTSAFLIIGGASFIVIGKVFTIKRWIKDGIQQNEISQLGSLIFGGASIIIGAILIFNPSLVENQFGFIGIIALIPAVYTFIDYLAKNAK